MVIESGLPWARYCRGPSYLHHNNHDDDDDEDEDEDDVKQAMVKDKI